MTGITVFRWSSARILLFVLLAVWAWVTLPWILGQRELVLRDVLFTHRHFKAFGAEQLSEGRIPAVNPTWGLGQPFRGNPNALPFYPGNLLYLLLPFRAAFHLHYALHWLLAFLGMRKLAGELGQSEHGRLLAALAWSGSGYLLSLLSFYNLLAVAAWAPLVVWGLARGGRRGTLLGGLACGLMLLAGEPLTAAMVGVPMVLVAVERRGLRRGLVSVLAVGGLGLGIALPQIVASARVLGFSFRAEHGIEVAEAGWQSLHPLRLLELLLPLPWGWPTDYARFGYWSKVVTPDIPYIYSIHVGVVACALAAFAVRSRWRWALVAASSLLLAWLGGVAPELLSTVTGGLFRYPQKMALLFTFAAALLAGWGLDRTLGSRRAAWVLAAAALAPLALALLFWSRFPALVEALRAGLAEGGKRALAETHAGQWMLGFAAAAILLGLAAWGVGRRRPALIVALQLVALAQLAPILVSDEAARYRSESPFARYLEPPKTIVNLPGFEPDWEPRLPYPIEAVNPIGQARVSWFQLDAPFGVPQGLRYPVAPDLEGLTTPLHVFLTRNLQLDSWEHRVPWLRRLGVGWIVRFPVGDVPGLQLVHRAELYGVPMELRKVPRPAPELAWPIRAAVAPNPVVAFAAVAAGKVEEDTVVLSRAVLQGAARELRPIHRTPDRWVFEVDGDGGIAVLQTAYHPIWRAWTEDGTPLATQPVDLVLLGVEVPAGRHRIRVEIPAWPEWLAGGTAATLALAALLLALRRPS